MCYFGNVKCVIETKIGSQNIVNVKLSHFAMTLYSIRFTSHNLFNLFGSYFLIHYHFTHLVKCIFIFCVATINAHIFLGYPLITCFQERKKWLFGIRNLFDVYSNDNCFHQTKNPSCSYCSPCHSYHSMYLSDDHLFCYRL